jgi:integrase
LLVRTLPEGARLLSEVKRAGANRPSSLRHARLVKEAGTAEREARRLRAQRDSGERVSPTAITLRAFVRDESELALLVAHAPDRYRTAVALLAYPGCRISEALSLRLGTVGTGMLL